jgi:hypothetical protein
MIETDNIPYEPTYYNGPVVTKEELRDYSDTQEYIDTIFTMFQEDHAETYTNMFSVNTPCYIDARAVYREYHYGRDGDLHDDEDDMNEAWNPIINEWWIISDRDTFKMLRDHGYFVMYTPDNIMLYGRNSQNEFILDDRIMLEYFLNQSRQTA